jgi:hypothetical protein
VIVRMWVPTVKSRFHWIDWDVKEGDTRLAYGTSRNLDEAQSAIREYVNRQGQM